MIGERGRREEEEKSKRKGKKRKERKKKEKRVFRVCFGFTKFDFYTSLGFSRRVFVVLIVFTIYNDYDTKMNFRAITFKLTGLKLKFNSIIMKYFSIIIN